MRSLIEIENLIFSYPAQKGAPNPPVLRNICTRVEEGEYVAVIGANGSGKTTLARHLNALLLPNSGRVLVNGADTRDLSNHAVIRSTIGMVFQHPEDQFVATLVEEDVAFGPETMGLPPAQVRLRVEESLHAVGMWEHRLRPPHMLSAGQMQRVAIAGVLALQPRCIIFDEATAMLDPTGRRQVQAIISDLHRRGLTVVTITHFMEEAAFAERIIVMNRGEIALEGSLDAVFSSEPTLLELGLDLPPAASIASALRKKLFLPGKSSLSVTGLVESLSNLPRMREKGLMTVHSFENKTPFRESTSQEMNSQPVIMVKELWHTYLMGTPLARLALKNISLSVQEKTAHGLIGATGSGKSTLLQHLNGLLRPQAGQVRVGSYLTNDLRIPLREIIQYSGLVFQDPDMQIFNQYVGDEIAYGPRILFPRESLVERVRWAMQMVGLDFEQYKDRLTFTLSGGERRKVALASVLSIKPQVLLLDEPTAGLDPVSRRSLIANLRGFQSDGLTLVLSSHQMEDMAALAQRLTVIENGKDILDGRVDEVYERVELLQQLGLEPPAVIQIAHSLRNGGWPLPLGIINQEHLVSEILKQVDVA